MAQAEWNGVWFEVVPMSHAHLITAAGNYNFCRWESWQPPLHRVLYTGEAGDMGDRFIEHIRDGRVAAAERLGATHVLVTTDFAGIADRFDLETVLRYELRPVLNRELPPMLDTVHAAAKRLGLFNLAYNYGVTLAQIRAMKENWGRGRAALTAGEFYGGALG